MGPKDQQGAVEAPKKPARRGRPKGDGPPRERITVWMPKPILEQLQAKAEGAGVSLSSLALTAMMEGLAR